MCCSISDKPEKELIMKGAAHSVIFDLLVQPGFSPFG
ncbi:hypothetical protein HMPREF1015_02163 [Bacillus smithii 7_3_47FAA]|uniref:Uncharacterized protein n=1 Tax=Bacillus smithii 7_3_47FAA TaxID=665952 RepID=G9QJ02_9BACI|nr:hypothetical protein HMPREF1015_02163 [Bacillus smithii 7_3_47FAA]